MAKFKIINQDQGHHYTHYVDAPDKETAMRRFSEGHYGSIVDCQEIKPVSETENKGNKTPEECKDLHGFFCKRVEEIRPGLKDNFNEWRIASKDPDVLMMYEIIAEYVELARTQEREKLIREIEEKIKERQAVWKLHGNYYIHGGLDEGIEILNNLKKEKP